MFCLIGVVRHFACEPAGAQKGDFLGNSYHLERALMLELISCVLRMEYGLDTGA